MPPATVVFVHGWSVTNTDTYGELPQRLAAEAQAAGIPLAIEHLWLSRYVSFKDEVRVRDLAWAMENAVRRDLADLLARKERFAVITHSTGGPVARAWQYEFWSGAGQVCPMSHLIMLAPANFGSALAQLGKGRLSRLKSWWNDVQPGQGVLDWLEHGSAEAWELNEAWIRRKLGPIGGKGVFPFVLTGQTIDRKLYDHLNSYTGELGSDGVVRVPAANLNAAMVRLVQQGPAGDGAAPLVPVGKVARSPRCAFRLIPGVSHSGEGKGIMRSVVRKVGGRGDEVVQAILRSLQVEDEAQYDMLCDAFEAETEAVVVQERAELEEVALWRDRAYVHDAMSLVIVRVTDSEGYPVTDLDFLLTGAEDNPDFLPEGFLADRQRNLVTKNMLTFFLNHDLMVGCDRVLDPRDEGGTAVLRAEEPGVDKLGFRVVPRPQAGFVHYRPATFAATAKLLRDIVREHETTLVDIVVQRVVHEGAFELGPAKAKPFDFHDTEPGEALPPQST